MTSFVRRVSRETLLLPVHAWRVVSHTVLQPRCKYHPSCSQYCLDAVRQRGVIAGVVLATWRLLRCNPWSLGGVDYVPTHGFHSTARRPESERQASNAPNSTS